MSRISRTLAGLRARAEPALVTYVVAGDPSGPRSLAALKACAAGGADLLEIGIPFSDPMADGAAIQRGHQRSLAAGMRLEGLWRLISDYRRQDKHTPIVLMGYYNSLLARGIKKFAARAARCGADGLLVVDMPPEESEPVRNAALATGLDTILLIAPGVSDLRLKQIVSSASGYLYYMTYRGVTGLAKLKVDEVERGAVRIRRATGDIPLMVGFGVRTAADAGLLANAADGVVAGSALVELCGAQPFRPAAVKQLVSRMKKALHAGAAPGAKAQL